MRRTFAQSCFLGGMGENGSGERRRNTGECIPIACLHSMQNRTVKRIQG